MANVVFSQRFEPGTSVELFETAGEGVMHVGASPRVGRRLSDPQGSVGFDGLTAGQTYIARGFNVEGMQREVRCKAVEDAADQHTAQSAAVRTLRPKLGTAGVEQSSPAPAPPAAVLQTGIPDGPVAA